MSHLDWHLKVSVELYDRVYMYMYMCMYTQFWGVVKGYCFSEARVGRDWHSRPQGMGIGGGCVFPTVKTATVLSVC